MPTRYEELLRLTIFPNIADRQIRGDEGAHLLRRDSSEGVEIYHSAMVPTL